ncbi:hypothetical protein B484DRAFT_263988, partial [Ochromonadaceae sp. CCMP2298]
MNPFASFVPSKSKQLGGPSVAVRQAPPTKKLNPLTQLLLQLDSNPHLHNITTTTASTTTTAPTSIPGRRSFRTSIHTLPTGNAALYRRITIEANFDLTPLLAHPLLNPLNAQYGPDADADADADADTDADADADDTRTGSWGTSVHGLGGIDTKNSTNGDVGAELQRRVQRRVQSFLQAHTSYVYPAEGRPADSFALADFISRNLPLPHHWAASEACALGGGLGVGVGTGFKAVGGATMALQGVRARLLQWQEAFHSLLEHLYAEADKAADKEIKMKVEMEVEVEAGGGGDKNGREDRGRGGRGDRGRGAAFHVLGESLRPTSDDKRMMPLPFTSAFFYLTPRSGIHSTPAEAQAQAQAQTQPQSSTQSQGQSSDAAKARPSKGAAPRSIVAAVAEAAVAFAGLSEDEEGGRKEKGEGGGSERGSERESERGRESGRERGRERGRGKDPHVPTCLLLGVHRATLLRLQALGAVMYVLEPGTAPPDMGVGVGTGAGVGGGGGPSLSGVSEIASASVWQRSHDQHSSSRSIMTARRLGQNVFLSGRQAVG